MLEMIFCPVYHGRWSAGSCASRHANAVARGAHAVGKAKPGADDPSCAKCPDGKARALALGPSGIKKYAQGIADCRRNTKRGSTYKPAPQEVKQMTESQQPFVQTIQEPAPSKPCKKCGEVKPLETGFHTSPSCKDGHENVCKKCKNEKRVQSYSAKKAGKPESRRKQRQPQPEAPSPQADQIGGDHYKHFAIQPIEFSTRNNLGFIQGCVVKRICRYNLPGGKGIQDLEKIIHEIRCLIEISGPGKEATP